MDYKTLLTSEGYLRTIFGVILAVVMVSFVPIAWADSINPGLYSPDSRPYGLSFVQWTEKWWQWLIGIPSNTNPTNDPTGKNCTVDQTDPNVFMITGAGAGSVVRSCTIPAGKAILVSVFGDECSTKENPSLTSESQLRDCAIAGDQISSKHVSLDGHDLGNLEHYKVDTPMFNVTFPDNNIFGAPAGPGQSVAESYLIFLAPLSAGNHVFHFDMVSLGSPDTSTQNFGYSVTYNLKVL